jgi:hypothetical protein
MILNYLFQNATLLCLVSRLVRGSNKTVQFLFSKTEYVLCFSPFSLFIFKNRYTIDRYNDKLYNNRVCNT